MEYPENDQFLQLKTECLQRSPVLMLTRIEDVPVNTTDFTDSDVGESAYLLRERKPLPTVFDSESSHSGSVVESESEEEFPNDEEETEEVIPKQKRGRRNGNYLGFKGKKKPPHYPRARAVKAERTCVDCGEVFKSLKRLGEHAADIHGNKTPFICSICKNSFGDSMSLTMHKVIGHAMETPVRIRTGEKKIKPIKLPYRTRLSRMSRREKQIIWSPADMICHYCGKKFDSALELKQHKGIHFKAITPTCELCEFTCKTPESLRHHFQIVHLGFKHTGSAKKMRERLKNSSEIPVEEQKAPFVACNLCDKIFWWEWKLNEHKARFHCVEVPGYPTKPGKPGKPYQCEECQLFFPTRNGYRRHLDSKKHTSEKRFICETCGKTFRKSDGIRKHIARQHPEVSLPKRFEYGLDPFEIVYPIHNVFSDMPFDEPAKEELVQLSMLTTAEGVTSEGQSQPAINSLEVVQELPPTETESIPAPPPAVEASADPLSENQSSNHEHNRFPSSQQLFGDEEGAEFEELPMDSSEVDTKPVLSELALDDTGNEYDETIQASPLPSGDGDDDLRAAESEPEHVVDKARLERLRRACRRRKLYPEPAELEFDDNYHEVSVHVKIEEKLWDERTDEEWKPDDEEVEDEPKRKSASKKKRAKSALHKRRTRSASQSKSKKRRTRSGVQETVRVRKPTTEIKCRLGGCRFRAVDRQQLIEHRTEAHGQGTVISYDFKCTKCPFRARTAESLEFHQITHEIESSPINSKESKKSQGQGQTGRTVAGRRIVPGKRKPDLKIKCRLGGCRFRAIDKEELAAHRLRVHGRTDGVRTYEFKCEVESCSFRARFKESYESHKLTHQFREISASACDDIQTIKSLLENTAETSKPKLNRRPYPCTYPGCPKAFSHRLRLVSHVQNIHNSPNTTTFDNVTLDGSVPDPVATDIYTNPRKCRLQGCKYVAKSGTEMEEHRRQVHGILFAKWNVKKRRHRTIFTMNRKWLYCGIDSCTFRALLPESITGHKRTAHDQLPPSKEFPCPHCDKVFSTNGYRHTHVLLKHSGPPKYLPRVPCMNCSRTFSSRMALFGHIQRAHPDVPTFNCSVCTKIFYYEDEKLFHESKHKKFALVPDMTYKCAVQFCAEVAPSLEALQSHVKAIHDVPIDAKTICPICGKEMLAYGYGAHLRTHSEKVRKYKCEHCEKSYLKPNMLERHSEMCHPELFEGQEKTFICDSCGMSFYQQGTFNIHRYTVHGKSKQQRLKNRGAQMSRRGPVKRFRDGEMKPRRKRRTKEEMMRDRAAAASAQVKREQLQRAVTQLAEPTPLYHPMVNSRTESFDTNSVTSSEVEVMTPPPPPPPPAHRNQMHFPQYYNTQIQSDPHAPLRSYFLQSTQNYPPYDPHYLYH